MWILGFSSWFEFAAYSWGCKPPEFVCLPNCQVGYKLSHISLQGRSCRLKDPKHCPRHLSSPLKCPFFLSQQLRKRSLILLLWSKRASPCSPNQISSLILCSLLDCLCHEMHRMVLLQAVPNSYCCFRWFFCARVATFSSLSNNLLSVLATSRDLRDTFQE